jgi:precorrin-6A synthase
MRRLLVIGIGAGDPEHMTLQAIRALNEADVVFVIAKPGARDELAQMRRDICERFMEREYRLVEIEDPERDRTADGYREAVEDWRAGRADAWGRAIADELADDGCGAFLVWGDPMLYDSTIAVIDDILDRGNVTFEHRVIPGISSIQALAAAHRVPLNQVGGAVAVMPGRLLREGWPEGFDDVVVMLDAEGAYRAAGPDIDIYWGAYVSSDDELLRSGPLTDEVMDDIEATRAEARERKGWVMDTYLLRRRR